MSYVDYSIKIKTELIQACKEKDEENTNLRAENERLKKIVDQLCDCRQDAYNLRKVIEDIIEPIIFFDPEASKKLRQILEDSRRLENG